MNRLVKIGLFVLLTGTGVTFYALRSAEKIDAPDTYRVQAYIEDASGLREGTQIWVSGVAVGKIREIQLDQGQALLSMDLSSEVPVYQNAVIKKQTQSMLGNAVVALNPGTPEAMPVSTGGMIPNVIPGTTMERAFDSAEKVAKEMETFMIGLNEFMGDQGGYKTLQEILTLSRDTVASTSRMVEANMILLQQSLRNIAAITDRLEGVSASSSADLAAVLQNTARITARIDALLARQDEELADGIGSLQESIGHLNASLASLESITARVEQGEGNLGRFIQDDTLYTRVDRVTRDVEEFVDSALGSEVQVGFRSEYMTQQQGLKNHADVRLAYPDKNKYYSLGVVSSSLEEGDSDDLRLSAQMARSWGPVTLRGGVIENSIGVGLEYAPLRQLSLDSEIFELSSSSPYLRGYGTFFPVFDPSRNNPLNWLYLSGGVDNALSSDRDYFLGLGMRLTDNDLKGVIPFVPSP